MLREVIIDGYNLLHADGLARPTYGPGDLDRSRRRLLMRLADLIDEQHRELFTIVFDAKDPPVDLPDRGEFKSMHVRYAQNHAEADDLIEELIHLHSTPKRLLVVSGDQRLRTAAKRKGANSVTSEEFLDALEAETELQPRKAEARPATSEAFEDVAQQFSELDVDLLRKEIELEAKPAAANKSTPTTMQPDSQHSAANSEGESASLSHPAEESRNITSEDEITFWNARIADLLRGDASSGGSPRRRDAKEGQPL